GFDGGFKVFDDAPRLRDGSGKRAAEDGAFGFEAGRVWSGVAGRRRRGRASYGWLAAPAKRGGGQRRWSKRQSLFEVTQSRLVVTRSASVVTQNAPPLLNARRWLRRAAPTLRKAEARPKLPRAASSDR